MKRGRAIWFGVALGVLPIPLGFAVPVPVPMIHILTTPGGLITLPFHNAMPGGGWAVMALISIANGFVYGLVARCAIQNEFAVRNSST